MLPFAALTVAGVAHRLCKGPIASGWRSTMAKRAGQLMVVCAVAASVLLVGPTWSRAAHRVMSEDDSLSSRQALAYTVTHIPKGSILLVDDNIWTDLVRRGFNPNPVWFYKLDLDPAIRARLKNGWRDIDYIVLGGLAPTTMRDLPLVSAAIQHSEVVASFGNGEITVRRVIKNAPEQPPTDPPAGSGRP
jgi:hypothetical protein